MYDMEKHCNIEIAAQISRVSTTQNGIWVLSAYEFFLLFFLFSFPLCMSAIISTNPFLACVVLKSFPTHTVCSTNCYTTGVVHFHKERFQCEHGYPNPLNCGKSGAWGQAELCCPTFLLLVVYRMMGSSYGVRWLVVKLPVVLKAYAVRKRAQQLPYVQPHLASGDA